jgi:aerobic carbon-monoxide dehydrogenase large subunit
VTTVADRTVGRRVKRVEDPNLVRGKGQFVDDIRLPGTLQAAFVRSPHAHAKILSVDVTRAKAMAGVHGIFTAADMPPGIRDHRMPLRLFNPSRSTLLTQYCLARDEVCYVGEPIGVIIAESRYLAEDAAALVDVNYETLSVIADCAAAKSVDSPPSRLGNENWAQFSLGYGDVGRAFVSAARVFRETLFQHRGSGHSMECRAVLARHDPSSDVLTVWSSTQMPHVARRTLSELLGRSEESIRVIAPDVGGGFGPKEIFYPEEAVIAAVALMHQQPVKWIEDRSEHFLMAVQERDQHWDVEVAVDAQGKLLGVRGELTADGGAYSPWGIVMPYVAAASLPGPYVLPAYQLNVAVCFTNKVPTAPVRGAGRPQAVFAMERLMDRVARELAIDRAELRQLNMIRPEQMPYSVGLMYRDGKPMIYDSGDYPVVQAKALEVAGYQNFEERRHAARAEGRFLGIGLANYVEATGVGPFEGGTVRILADGSIVVRSGVTSQGQGHKTVLAQVCADQLGVAVEDVKVLIGDTDGVSMGVGTYSSRAAVTAGSAVHVAAKTVRTKLLKLAARVLNADETDLVLDNGRVELKTGNRQSLGLGELARLSQGLPGATLDTGGEPGLEHTAYFAPERATYSNGTHVVEVEIDVGTGGVRILNYVVAHDSGTLLNSMIVDGQIHGGVTHGIGNALYEWMIFDENGQPVTTNFADYMLPMLTDVPTIKILHHETRSPLNPLGVKGAGEGGTIPAAAAIISAIEDALTPFGVHIDCTPVTPERIMGLIKIASLPRQMKLW